ncbi:MAG: TolC family protein [Candidatus Acidiferrales bacterium]|jgi:cobalt-zinc-cadmium efflux system outer membrane protein
MEMIRSLLDFALESRRLALPAAVLLFAGALYAQGPVKITLDQAVQMAHDHNHSLKAARTTIQQDQAQEITANLRPNPTLSADSQFLPIFQPGSFTNNYVNEISQFDVGISYLFERGGKRQRRLEAAQDATAVTRSTVDDNERTLAFSVATQFVNVQLAESTLDLALQDVKSFQNTVDISEARYQAGDMSEADYLKIELQLLQFQSDVANARMSRATSLVSLREFLGYESVPADFDVAGDLEYQPLNLKEEDLAAMALKQRADLRAAQQGITAAQSQIKLAQANGKKDFTGAVDYSHVSGYSSLSIFGSIDLPIFDRNQGEIARTRYALTQAQELELAAAETVVGDVNTAYETLHANDEIMVLYRGGYLEESEKSRDISEYAYKRGAASLLDFLDAERSYRAIQLAYRQALAAYALALEQMREAVGTRNLP